MAMAADLGLDWVRVPVEWDTCQVTPNEPICLEILEPVMQLAEKNGIAVLVSISNPPAWAMTRDGPDAQKAAQFAGGLVSAFPGSIAGLELFPGANTRQGWNANANPQAYFDLLRKVEQQLGRQSASTPLVAGGLRPLPAFRAAGDMDDLMYLQELYRLGASQYMPVISLQYVELTGQPLTLPQAEDRVLRHYEDVRQIMVENHHQAGMIWITHLSLPSGKISVIDSGLQDPIAQSIWLGQAYLQLRSQLYVGVAFLQSLNIHGEDTAYQVPSLLDGKGETHPFYPVLHEMIRLNQSSTEAVMSGKGKEGSFKKMQP